MATPEPNVEFRPGRHAPMRELPLWTVLFVAGLVLTVGLRDGGRDLVAADGSAGSLDHPDEGAVVVVALGSPDAFPQLVDVSSARRAPIELGRQAAHDGGADIMKSTCAAGAVQGDLGFPTGIDVTGGSPLSMGDGEGPAPMEEGPFIRGVRNGEWLVRWPDGGTQSMGRYENGLRVGHWQSFSLLGQLVEDTQYADGALEGTWRSYSLEGALIGEGQHEDSHRSGTWTLRYSDGRIKETGTYVNGLREGEWEFYDDLGLPTTRSGHYRAGVKID